MSVEATGPASSAIRPCQGVVSWPITTFCCCMIFHGSNAASTIHSYKPQGTKDATLKSRA